MMRNPITSCFLIILTTTVAYADYSDLKKEFDLYTPPAYLQPREDRAPIAVISKEDKAFIDEKKRIELAIGQWEKSLASTDLKTVFYWPESHLLESIRSAEEDSVAAAEALAKEFSLETLEALVFLRNPGVKAAEKRFKAAIEGFTQVTALDEILRRYTAFTEGLMPGVGPMKGKDPVMMKFPFPGVFSLKGEIVQQEVRAERESLEVARRDAITATRISFWKLLYNRKAQKIAAETLNLLKRLEEVAATRYEAGKTSFQDVIKVRIERDTLDEKLITLREMQRNIELELLELLNLTPKNRLGSPREIEPHRDVPALEVLYQLALERRQELRHRRAAIGKMERMIEMAETMIMPPFTLGLSVYEDEAITQVGSGAMKETFPVDVKASSGAGLPKMPWYGSSDAYLRQTRQKLLALREDLKKAETATVTMVRKAWFELDREKREESLYRDKVVRNSQAALDVSSRGYESGNISFVDVISSYTIWLQANLAIEKRRSELGIAWAELERTVGATLR
ncbi:MAG: TolC family protein [Pseudomonadota bacterium]